MITDDKEYYDDDTIMILVLKHNLTKTAILQAPAFLSTLRISTVDGKLRRFLIS